MIFRFFYILFFLSLISFSNNSLAAQCSVYFPGASPLASYGSISTIDIKGSAKCNGGSCSIENVTEESVPTIPSGGSDLGEFNRGNLSDEAYNFYNNWKDNRTSVTFNDSSGTAVIYIERNGNDLIIPENTNLNVNGIHADVLLVIKTDKKVEIGKNSTFNAFVYIVADEEVKINEDVTINGAFTVITDKLTVEERVEFNYDISDLDDFDPHGFCSSAPILVAKYQLEENTWGGNDSILDTSGNNNHASPFGNIVPTNDNPISCQAADIPYNSNLATRDAISTSVNVNTLGDAGSIAFWYRSNNAWNESSDAKVLFDASTSSDAQFLMYIWPGGYLEFEATEPNGDRAELYTSVQTFSADEWVHVAITWDATNDDVKIYLNGASQSLSNETGKSLLDGLHPSMGSLFFGDNNSPSQSALGGSADGALDEVHLFNYVLSSAQVNAVYADITICAPDLVIDYRFDEETWDGTSGEVKDNSGNALNGTAVDGPNTSDSSPDSAIVGDPGTCLYGDFSYQAVETPDNDFLDMSESFTLSAWIRHQPPDSNLFENTIITKGDGASLNYRLSVQTDGDLRLAWDGGSLDSVTKIATDGTWVHVAASYKNGEQVLYINGFADASSTSTDILSTNNNDLIIGRLSSGVSGSGFVGQIDEVRVYSVSLAADDIVSIYNETHACTIDTDYCASTFVNGATSHASGGKIKFEGTTSTIFDDPTGNLAASSLTGTGSCPDFGDCSVTSTPTDELDLGDFKDSSLADGSVLGIASDVTLGSVVGENNYDQITVVNGGVLTFSANNSEYRIKTLTVLEKDESWSATVNFTAGDYYIDTLDTFADTTINVIGSGQVRLFLQSHSDFEENTQVNIDGNPNDVLIYGWAEVHVKGDNTVNSTEIYGMVYSQGKIEIKDSAKVHGAISAGSEAKLKNSAEIYYLCSTSESGIDHFEILHDGEGLTCQVESINIKACSDASCSTLNHDAVDVQLSVNGNLNQTVTVVGGETTTEFSYTTPDTATLSLDQTYECENGASSSCDVVFADTGFLFSTVPTQLSGKPSDTGFNASTLNIQAIETSGQTGQCEAALIDDVTIELAATCVDPTNCAAESVIINNLTSDTSISTLNAADALTYTNVALDFGANTENEAPYIFNYGEAGQVQLHARYNIPDENNNPTGNYMTGSSSSFVVRPLGFYTNIAPDGGGTSTNPAATDASGGVFISAGTSFTTELTAKRWANGDDSNNDGIPDSNAVLSDNTTTVNFGHEISGETADISHTLYLPSGGVTGSLSDNTNIAFSNGTVSQSLSYSEVGIISFDVNLSDNTYLGADDISSTVPYIGRFIPDYFELSIVDNGSLAAVCDGISVDMPYAYSGQMSTNTPTEGALRYFDQPSFLISAKSLLNNTTQNYRDDFIKLLLSGVDRELPTADETQLGVDLVNEVNLTAQISDGAMSDINGEITYEYHSGDHYVYLHEKNAEIAPFIAQIPLAINAVVDTDGVAAQDADGDPLNSSLLTIMPVGKEIRFGRGYLENSYGPETSPLPQVLQVQYLNNSGNYIVNVDDICSQYASSNISLTNISLSPPLNESDIIDVSGSYTDGMTREITLPAPGESNQGQVSVIYDIDDWLQYDWSGDDNFNENPTAIATFGIYRGNDRIIYQREINR